MPTLTTGISRLRTYATDKNRDLFRVVVNATSTAEATLALQILSPEIPEKVLVTACNLREVLRTMPVSPFSMRVDEQTLIRSANLEKRTAALSRTLPDGLELVVTTAGNLVLDVIVRNGADKLFWTPIPVVEDFVNPQIVDLLIDSDYLLTEAIDLFTGMGLVFNPRFYMSVDDFTLEYASDTLAGLEELF